MSKLTDDEKEIFAKAMDGVTPLQKPMQKAWPKTQKSLPKRKKRFNENISSDVVYEDSINLVSAHESLFFQRYAMSRADMKALKNGNFRYHWTIDLHGETEKEAEQNLLTFLNEALAHRQKHVLIVHGKGYHSDVERPVLKNLVNQVLQSWPHIVAFCSATQKDGGTGATYVFLKLEKELG